MSAQGESWKARAEILVERPLEMVWQAWSQLDRLTAWYAPTAAGDLTNGSQLVLQWNDLNVAIRLDVEAVRAPFEFALAADLGVERQRQLVRLEERGEKTLVEVVHRGGVDDFLASGIEAGWRTQLEMLRLYLERYAGKPRAYVAEKAAIEAPDESGFAYLVAPDLLSTWLGEFEHPIEEAGQEVSLKVDTLRFEASILSFQEPHEIALHFPDERSVLRCRQIPLDRRAAGVKMLVVELSMWGEADARTAALLEAVRGASARLAGRVGLGAGSA